MRQILIDTNAWIALYHRRDQYHDKAIRINQQLLINKYGFITTNFILDETYTGLVSKVNYAAAIDLGERIKSTKFVNVIHITEIIEEKAWEIFKKYSDKKYSFTDCTTFVILNQLNLKNVFTADHHFKEMGYEVLLDL